jgi:tetratricopeptide (TPR) repeat protein
VDKLGVVVWSGSPFEGLDAALADAVAGKLVGDKAKQRQAAKKLLEQFVQAAGSGVDEGKLGKMAGELEALDAELGGIEPGVKFDAADVRKRIKFDGLMRDYQLAVLAGSSSTNLARIEKKLDEFAPKDFDLAGFKETVALNKVGNEYFDAASGKGNTNNLPALTKRISEAKTKNPQFLLKIAWTILQLEHRDLDLAAKLAKSAVDLTESTNVDTLFVYGRVLLESGKITEAINCQKKAIAAAGDNEQVRQQLEGTLEQYQEKLAKK